jgi:hypothetical protein
MQRTRIVLQRVECNCNQKCDGDGPTPYPLGNTSLEGVNDVGKHCLIQSRFCNSEGVCNFLQWKTRGELKIESIEQIQGDEYVKIRKNW